MKILFFASIAEFTKCDTLLVQQVSDTESLKMVLKDKFPGIEKLSFSIAVNKNLVTSKADLAESDEVALLPPFSGG